MGKFKTIPKGWVLMSEAANRLGIQRTRIYEKKKLLRATNKHPKRPGVWLIEEKRLNDYR